MKVGKTTAAIAFVGVTGLVLAAQVIHPKKLKLSQVEVVTAPVSKSVDIVQPPFFDSAPLPQPVPGPQPVMPEKAPEVPAPPPVTPVVINPAPVEIAPVIEPTPAPIINDPIVTRQPIVRTKPVCKPGCFDKMWHEVDDWWHDVEGWFKSRGF